MRSNPTDPMTSSPHSSGSGDTPVRSELDRLVRGERRAILTFAGQGASCIDELATLYAEVPMCRTWVERASEMLSELPNTRLCRWSGLYGQGFDLMAWLQEPEQRPDTGYLTSAPISQPLIFLTQMARYAWAYENGLDRVFEAGGIVGVAGHSQGMMAALLVSECDAGTISLDRLVEHTRYLAWQGFHMARAWSESDSADHAPGATPMAAVSGMTLARLQTLVDEASQPGQIAIALRNTRTRHVVSGAPTALARLEQHLERTAAREKKARSAGQFGGTPLTYRWEYLEVEAAYHSSAMEPARRALNEFEPIAAIRFSGADLGIPAFDPYLATPMNEIADLQPLVIERQCSSPVCWSKTVRAALEQTAAQTIIDLGPGVGVARLSSSTTKGTGVRVLALSEPSGRAALTRDEGPAPIRYADFRPTLSELPNGAVVVNNRYTRATGMPPVVLPGMTPTTVDAGICAAAANAGFTAELAGGGQVTERIFELRMEELVDHLEPGRQVVFNALYLDRYLWDLHLGPKGLVQKAARAGAPLCGVTVSAGIPEPEEAVTLLDELHDAGLWLNAFKPGTVSQVRQVLAIAKAAPTHTVFMHLEGGRAGGHHSWEDLTELMLATYHDIRSQPNVVLCVGGGIADETRGVELLTGRWAHPHGLPDMPVDAILLGTVTMACLEATATASVKQALVDAAGTVDWVFAGNATGGITSGKSQLDADIHYLDTAAARCGRLLDTVAGDADAAAARKADIVAALAQTAKPYFGDIADMSWFEVLERMVQLMAIGRFGRYEDGPWPDASYRARVADVVRRAESRLAREAGDSVLTDLSDLDDPHAVLQAFVARYPHSRALRPLATDAEWFVRAVCARAGKPVCFVPTIDGDVRRWFKSDSLWQAQDPRFTADQVLVIPGPAAVRGIRQVDEPIAQILGRFDSALIADRQGHDIAEPAPWLRRRDFVERSPNVSQERTKGWIVLGAGQDVTDDEWFDYVASANDGPVARAFAEPRIFDGHASIENPVRRLCRPEPGAVLRVELDAKTQARAITYHPAEPWDDETVSLTATNGGIRVEVRPRHVPGAPRLRPWTFAFRVDELGNVHTDRTDQLSQRRAFYHHSLFGRLLEPIPLFETATRTVKVDEDRLTAYACLSEHALGSIPVNMLFTLAWEAQFAVLSCDELVAGLSRLVHHSNRVTWNGPDRLTAGDELDVAARATRVSGGDRGTEVNVHTEFRRANTDTLVATMTSVFYIRGTSSLGLRAREPFTADITVADDAARGFVLDHAWWTPKTSISVGDTLRLEAVLESDRTPGQAMRCAATGVVRRGDDLVAHIHLEDTPAATHPIRALVEVLGALEPDWATTPSRTLATEDVPTPRNGVGWADVSRDLNPIHVSGLFARMAGFDAPIVHGMWSAARLQAFLVRHLADNDGTRVDDFEAQFLAPAHFGETLRLTARRVAARDGRLRVECTATALRDGADVPVVRATAVIQPARTAYIFPGQGIQKMGMGMDAYARSAAARDLWNRADAFTRQRLGFSILHIVRTNPRAIQVGDTRYHHPRGVLHLTQFTQVAMAVLAQAQVAELRAAGAMTPQAITCGHSVGEYNAISAAGGVIGLEAVVEVVWGRGLTMHRLVPRDATGRSPYRMGVVRPHYAGLAHEQVSELVDQVRAESGGFIEIVNFNVAGRQYAVTGEIAALHRLSEHLLAQAIPGGKAPWVEVPGVDVPFHSTLLRPGVPAFRHTLQQCMPPASPYLALVGRYIPNLVARPMSLDRSYFELVYDATQSPVIHDILEHFETAAATPNALARTLLIELLAWQFASPVRWIETQDLLLELGVARVVELGVGYQPTAANMMRATLAQRGRLGVEVWNLEADAERALLTDTDPVIEVPEEAAEHSPEERTAAAEPPPPPRVVAPASTAAAAPEDRPVSHLQGLKAILAWQAKVRVDQLREDETIDQIFEGVSSRRNQVLLDIGAEFQLGTIDGAHEKPLHVLAAEVAQRSPRWRFPGKYLAPTLQDATRRALGRSGMGQKDAMTALSTRFGLGSGLASASLLELMLHTRPGDSARGGALGVLQGREANNRDDANTLLDASVEALGQKLGIAIAPLATESAGGGVVDSAMVDALEAKMLGPDGVLMRGLEDMAHRLGRSLETSEVPLTDPDDAEARLALLEAEHGATWASLVSPRFEAQKHVLLSSSWAWARRDIAQLFYGAFDTDVSPHLARLADHARHDEAVAHTARWYADLARSRGDEPRAAWLDQIADGSAQALAIRPARPLLTDDFTYTESVQTDPTALDDLLTSLESSNHISIDNEERTAAYIASMRAASTVPLDFRDRTAVVTGASPGSIAVEVVSHLLRGGARVVATTTTYNDERLDWYRGFFQRHAGPGAELHIVPFNQASNQDVDALVDWLFSEVTEQDGANIRVLKPALVPDLLLPFAALKDLGTIDTLGPKAEAVMRVMLLSVERLTGAIARRLRSLDTPAQRPCHIVLPLSPNHGSFGGDGVYAETKAALEVLAHKWHSEYDAWGHAVSLCMTKIGWVRGTGLMDANNLVAPGLEARSDARTFSSAEMGWLIAGLCTGDSLRSAQDRPVHADLTGGFARLGDVRAIVDAARADIERARSYEARRTRLFANEAALLGAPEADTAGITPWPAPPSEWPVIENRARSWPTVTADLTRTVVVVGTGELGPCGSSRTRLALEVEDRLSAAAVLELAWMTGLVRYENGPQGGGWVDVESGEPVDEPDIADRYREAVRERSGLRLVEPESAGFDPGASPVYQSAWLDRDFTFSVSSESEARAFVAADPDRTRAAWDPDRETWQVTRQAGTEIRVPKVTRLSRQVMGMLPTGFDLARFGLPNDMIESVDRLTLFNLIATVDAFISAGLTPEELMQWVHPTRVANTQGSGIGGMRSLHRLYVDHVLGRERQSDVLQETLINVIAAYAVTSYVGSYGSMSHPVGACATAAASLESAVEKILTDKADIVVAGGYDDLGVEGTIGFGDMNATADTDRMLAMGISPHRMSRANDMRRRGFVSAQGGGTILLARGDVAQRMGLPVRAVLAYAATFGDGLHKSIPAPGQGALASGMGGKDSGLGRALSAFGLTADDIGVVYKHDTSTGANDPNENRLHHHIQNELGRTRGNPLFVVSQKTLTGHSKGGAAAWQTVGLCQTLATGTIAPNRSLESVDPTMRQYEHMAFTDQRIDAGPAGLRAGLMTSLGFGHVSGIALLIHPDAFIAMLSDEERSQWQETVAARQRAADATRLAILTEQRATFARRTHRRFESQDGSDAQLKEEAAMLLDPAARFDPTRGIFTRPAVQ